MTYIEIALVSFAAIIAVGCAAYITASLLSLI